MRRPAAPATDEGAATSSRRADLLLVERGFFESRAKAQAAIEAGLVQADGRVVRRPSATLRPDAEVVAEASHPYVSRGGVKLAHALDHFRFDPAGRVCIDVGASTGGFTDVLLGRGATRVVAIDVGHGQLHPRIAADPRVQALEGVDIRALDPGILGDAVDLAVVDVSFISLRLVLPELNKLVKGRAQLVALIKPQFEVGRCALGRGGIVRDDEARQAATDRIAVLAAELGWRTLGVVPSLIAGGDGNREYLLGAARD